MKDTQVSADQYHKMTNELYQWENATDDLIQQWKTMTSEEQRDNEWKQIKEGVS